jgi:nucleoside-diphosphate-sugar epimerase
MTTPDHIVTLIGGGGYLGSVLTRQLLAKKYRVRVFDNFQWGRDGIAELKHEALEVIEGDICDIKALSRAISGSEVVVLLAAVVGRRSEEIARPFSREINLLASSVVLDAAIEHMADRFIFISTDSVYGVQTGVMYETGTPDPISLYCRLKLRMEEQVIKAKRRTFHPTALRVATCYGCSPRMRFDLVVNTFVRDALCRNEIIVQGGEQCRAFIHVEDAARVVASCVKAHVNLISGEIFNVGAPDQVLQLNQLANIVKTIIPDTAIRIEDGEPDLTDYHLSCSKVQKILDFTPRWTIAQGVEQIRDAIVEGRYPDPYAPKYHNT